MHTHTRVTPPPGLKMILGDLCLRIGGRHTAAVTNNGMLARDGDGVPRADGGVRGGGGTSRGDGAVTGGSTGTERSIRP